MCFSCNAAAPTAASQPAATQAATRKTQEGTTRSIHVVPVS